MRKYRHHVFVCTNHRFEGHPKKSCSERSEGDNFEALAMELELSGLSKSVLVSSCHCLGPCELGPCVVVYPEGVWYKNVDDSAVDRIVREHLLGGKPVEDHILNSYVLEK